MPKTDIIDDLLIEKGRMEGKRVEAAKGQETMTTAVTLITQLRSENARLESENAELRHHLNRAPAGPITDAEAPY